MMCLNLIKAANMIELVDVGPGSRSVIRPAEAA